MAIKIHLFIWCMLLCQIMGQMIGLITGSNSVLAQEQGRVELLRADALEGGNVGGKNVRKLIGHVELKQQTTLLFCDSAYQYIETGELEAFGRVVIRQSSNEQVSSRYLKYDSKTRWAHLVGNVILNKENTQLFTEVLDYNFQTEYAIYQEGGKIIDKDNTLTSTMGTYDKKQKLFSFKKNVVLINPEYKILTDTMQYHSESGMVYLRGPSEIIGKDGNTIIASQGFYNTKTKQSEFEGRTTIKYESYLLTGDKVIYKEKEKYGEAHGHVILVAQKDSLTLYGASAFFWGKKGKTKVFGNSLLQAKSGKDTLWIRADTMISIQDTVLKKRELYAYHRARIYKKDLQAVCDSLYYNIQDSVTHLIAQPIIWSGKNQISGDSIIFKNGKKGIKNMWVRQKAFSISKDTLGNYNQARGKYMEAHFSQGKIKQIDFLEDGESIYYSLEEDTALLGLNTASSKNIKIRFEGSKLKTIAYVSKPVAKFIPVHEIKPEDERLQGFKWRANIQPTRSEMYPNAPPQIAPYIVSPKKQNKKQRKANLK